MTFVRAAPVSVMFLAESRERAMAKIVYGVIIGLFIGTSASAWAAHLFGSGTLNGWTVTNHGEAICVNPIVVESVNEIDCE